MKDDSAFPKLTAHDTRTGYWHSLDGGLSKRELYAAIVMQKIARATMAPETLKVRAQISVAHADALIAALEAEHEPKG